MQDYEEMLNAYQQAGGAPEIFKNSTIAHIVVHKNNVMGSHLVKGLILDPEETADGVNIKLKVGKGIKIDNPVHLCFGVLPEEGMQVISIKAEIENDAEIRLLAHCVFPNAVRVVHKMTADIEVGNNAFYEYNEVHYHGLTGGIEVIPKAKIKVGDNSRLITGFSLLKGRVGILDIDYDAEIQENAILEMNAKVYGAGNDRIKIREACCLSGKNSRGLIKSRVAITGDAYSEVISELVATAPWSRGHVDCIEVIQGNAAARAIPVVDVSNEFAQVTHEAAIGRVDKKQIETLMARGLEQDEAIDLVIRGILS